MANEASSQRQQEIMNMDELRNGGAGGSIRNGAVSNEETQASIEERARMVSDELSRQEED